MRDKNGTPIAGAVVVTSAGGRAVTDESGEARFSVNASAGADSLHVTAAASIEGATHTGTARVSVADVADDSIRAVIETGVITVTEGAQPEPQWLPTFGPAPGLDDTVFNMVVFDDGSGPALFVSGVFRIAGSVTASRIAKWDGVEWSPLGSGVQGSGNIRSLAVFDDGAGPALFAGGIFDGIGGVAASGVAKWDGVEWSSLGTGLVTIPLGSGPFASQPSGTELAVFDDGSGPALYVSGRFQIAGGIPANNIAKWDGASWSPLGAGLVLDAHPAETGVPAMTVFDDGTGPALYAGGEFTSAGGAPARNLAKWDGETWTQVGLGANGEIFDLAVYDDGAGPALYVGGEFTSVGFGMSANSIAKWDGAAWSPLGAGLTATVANLGVPPAVFDLEVFDDGSGPALFVGGLFLNSGTILSEEFVRVNCMAKWDGTAWSALDNGLFGGVDGLAVFDDRTGPALYAGGIFTADFAQDGSLSRGDTALSRIARWDGTDWSPVGDNKNVNNPVLSAAVFNDGAGPALYAGGTFVTAGGATAERIAKWDGVTWSPLAGGINTEGAGGQVNALTSFDAGAGAELYAGGSFGWTKTPAGQFLTLSNIGRWDGVSWSPVDTGVGGGPIFALAVFDDGSGPALYAAGDLSNAGGTPASRIAKWDGVSWSPLGSGIGGSRVNAMTVFDDGTGTALYVGGIFSSAGGVSANRVAKWDGSAWSFVGASTLNNGVAGGVVQAMTVFDDGSGPALYVGGSFTSAGGVTADHIAKWDGVAWSPVGVTSDDNISFFNDLSAFDDGSGPALYVGGAFASIGGVAANNIARWDGAAWSPIDAGVSSVVRSLTNYNNSDGASLIVAGDFAESPAGDSFIARIAAAGVEPPAPSPDLNSDGIVDGTDLLILLNEFGGPGAADLNNDGAVDGTDLLILLNAFGAAG